MDSGTCPGDLSSDYVSRMDVVDVSTDSKHESKFIPTAVIVRFIDAHTVRKQTHHQRDWHDEPVPKSA
jgi:hypothetical protein